MEVIWSYILGATDLSAASHLQLNPCLLRWYACGQAVDLARETRHLLLTALVQKTDESCGLHCFGERFDCICLNLEAEVIHRATLPVRERVLYRAALTKMWMYEIEYWGAWVDMKSPNFQNDPGFFQSAQHIDEPEGDGPGSIICIGFLSGWKGP
jgi:hypothetical protein